MLNTGCLTEYLISKTATAVSSQLVSIAKIFISNVVILPERLDFFNFLGKICKYWRYRLVWSRTPRFQCGNPGSNPGGATKFMESLRDNFEDEENMEDAQKLVPENEITEQFSRSGGSGGQNVNKLSTKAEVRWNVESSTAFTDEEKEKIKQVLENRINKEGELIIASQEERSQLQNRERAIERLNNLVSGALIPEKERIATKPTRSSKERRLEAKKHQGEKKKSRSEKPKINDY